MGRAAAVTDEVASGHQPSSKVVTPKMRSCARSGGGPRYIRAQPKTSIIRLLVHKRHRGGVVLRGIEIQRTARGEFLPGARRGPRLPGVIGEQGADLAAFAATPHYAVAA